MSTDDWVKVAAVAVTIFNPALSIALTAWLNYKITSNKDFAILELDIDNGDDCVAVEDSDYNDGMGKVPRCHVRFRLHVKGSPNGAKKCDVKLLRVFRIEKSGNSAQISYPNKYSLHWNTEWKSGEHAEKDLPHGTEQYVDLLNVQVIGGNVSIKLKDLKYTNLPLEMGNTYRFDVQATSGNARAVGRMVEIVFGEEYPEVQVKRSRSIRV